MAQQVDIKNYSTFGNDGDVSAEYNSALGTRKSSGLALSAFNLSYGQRTTHFVETVTAQAQIFASAPPPDDRFRFKMEASMIDSSENQAISAATFTVPAVFANASGGPSLELQTGEAGSKSNFPFSQTLSEAYAVLGGFSVGYGRGNNHHVAKLKASASISNQSGNIAFVDGMASISDNSNHSGSAPVRVLVIGKFAGDSTQFRTRVWNPSQGQVTLTLDKVDSIDQAAVFITSFEFEYPQGDHEVRQILLDTGNNSLTVTNDPGRRQATIQFTPRLILTDGNNKANGTFNLLLMAVPGAAA
jgi:hypothetical protein